MNKSTKNSKNKAFTLAEVLVTLAVIGIVAALTIPSLLKNYQDKANYTKWKKVFSTASQAFIAVKDDIDFSDSDNIYTALTGVLKYTKSADRPSDFIPVTEYRHYKNENTGGFLFFDDDNYKTIAMPDGSVWIFTTLPMYDNCSYTLVDKGRCASIIIDVNGSKSPNMAGKDLFALWITRDDGKYYVDAHGPNNDDLRFCNTDAVEWTKDSGCSHYALFKKPDEMP